VSQTAGPILGIGAITVFRDTIIGHQKITGMWKVIAATGMGVIVFSGFEKINSRAAVGVAYLALVTAIVVPPSGRKSFAEDVAGWLKP
jgi:hypothetical protein